MVICDGLPTAAGSKSKRVRPSFRLTCPLLLELPLLARVLQRLLQLELQPVLQRLLSLSPLSPLLLLLS